VIRAALKRFDDEDAAEDAWLMELAEEVLADPRPSIPAEQVFRELRAKYGRPELIDGNRSRRRRLTYTIAVYPPAPQSALPFLFPRGTDCEGYALPSE